MCFSQELQPTKPSGVGETGSTAAEGARAENKTENNLGTGADWVGFGCDNNGG